MILRLSHFSHLFRDFKVKLYPLFSQNGSLFYFFIEDWQFVNEFRHVVGKKMPIFMLRLE